MASEWPRHALSDLCDSIVDCPHSTPKWTERGVVVLRNQNIKNGRLDLSSPSYTDEEHYEQRSRRARLQAGDLVITREAPMGEVCMVPDGLKCCLGQRMVMLRPNDGKAMGRYLLYSLQSRQVQHEIKVNEGTGSTVSNLRIPLLKALPIPTPPLPVQQRIADVLGKLDDKIELNRRMNRTLEKMAAAIFKSWFIDFDPVHAKAAPGNGPDPASGGLPAEIADLFPDTFEDSDLGPIPKGWTPGKLADVADNPRRTVQPSDVAPTTPYIGLQHMPRRCIALDAWGRADEVGSGKSHFKEGEILFGKLRPYFHKVGIAPVDGVCSTDILVVVPKSLEWHSYVLSLVSSQAFVDYTDSHSAGTKMPRTNWKDMGRYPLALPPEPLAKAFQDHVAALHQRIGLAVRQNRRLAGLRDTLLPELLNGEIELPEAEAIAEEVA